MTLTKYDDTSGAGKVNRLREWWDLINKEGPKYGYYTNASKTWFFCKEDCLPSAVATFADTDVKVTSEGRPYLGAALGSEEYIQSFVTDKVLQWVEELELASIAETHSGQLSQNSSYQNKISLSGETL